MILPRVSGASDCPLTETPRMGTPPMLPEDVEVQNPSDVAAEMAKPVPRRRLHIQGKLVKIDGWDGLSVPPPSAMYRKILMFSPSSRRRLLKRIAIVDWDKLTSGFFLTLTYPDECAAVGPKYATIQRSWMIRNMEKAAGAQVPVLWRKEYTARKSGELLGQSVHHWHLSVFTDKEISVDRINDWWRSCLGWKWEVQVQLQKLKTAEHAAFYLAKYLSKENAPSILDYAPNLNTTGRCWGWTRWNDVPRKESTDVDCVPEELWQKILVRARLAWNSEESQFMDSFCVLGPAAETLAKEIFEILY